MRARAQGQKAMNTHATDLSRTLGRVSRPQNMCDRAPGKQSCFLAEMDADLGVVLRGATASTLPTTHRLAAATSLEPKQARRAYFVRRTIYIYARAYLIDTSLYLQLPAGAHTESASRVDTGGSEGRMSSCRVVRHLQRDADGGDVATLVQK